MIAPRDDPHSDASIKNRGSARAHRPNVAPQIRFKLTAIERQYPMFTRSTRILLISAVGIVLVLNSVAAAGTAFTEPTDEYTAHSHHGAEPITSTSGALDSSSSANTILSASSATATSIVLLAGHSRSGGADPLEHDVREEIHEIAHRASGIYVSDLQETCDHHRSTLRHHLEVLEEEALLSSETIFGKLWYYPSGSDVNQLRAALTHDPTGEILEAIARLEPVSVTDLASEVDRSSSTVSHHLDRLEDKGLIEQEHRSTSVLSRLEPDVRTELETPANPEDSARW